MLNVKMLKTSAYCLFLFMIVIGCSNYDVMEPTSAIIGRWEWLETQVNNSGGLLENRFTPASTYRHVYYEYYPNGDLKIIDNDTVTMVGAFTLSSMKDTLSLFLPGDTLRYQSTFSNTSMTLRSVPTSDSVLYFSRD